MRLAAPLVFRFAGKGVFQYADGDRFEGEYFEGQMDGMGVYRWSNGRRALFRLYFFPFRSAAGEHFPDVSFSLRSIFKGQWKENNMHGCGKKWYPGGAIEEARSLFLFLVNILIYPLHAVPPAELLRSPAGGVDRG